MIATSASSRESPHIAIDTVACSGFSDDRANTIRPGLPTEATSRPVGSHTATCPRWTDSSSPERTTLASTAGSLTCLRGGDLGQVFLVPALQLVLELVVR